MGATVLVLLISRDETVHWHRICRAYRSETLFKWREGKVSVPQNETEIQ